VQHPAFTLVLMEPTGWPTYFSHSSARARAAGFASL